jgi:hypothetical protein
MMNTPMDQLETLKQKGKLIYRLVMRLDATRSEVWNKIAHVDEIRSWDSMIMNIDGDIRDGGEVSLRSAISPDRKFKLKISQVVPKVGMTWQSGFYPLFRGVRTYKITEDHHYTILKVEEVFEGWLLPLMAKQLPDCEQLFGTYAKDLRKALKAD